MLASRGVRASQRTWVLRCESHELLKSGSAGREHKVKALSNHDFLALRLQKTQGLFLES